MVSGVRQLTAWAMFVLLAAFVAVVTVPSATKAGAATPHGFTTRPNVIVVLTDDMRADELRYLPAVRRLARSGVTFTRALSADSLCCPARATLLTGKLAHNHLTIGNYVESHGGYPVFAANNSLRDLLPRWLRLQGYRTAWIGKYMNGIPDTGTFDQPSWSYFAVPVHTVYDYEKDSFAINGTLHTRHQYREDYTRHLLLSKVRTWSARQRPFFALYSALAPHHARDGSHQLAPETQKAHRGFDRSRLVVPPSVDETDLSDKPAWLQAYAQLHGMLAYPRRLEAHRIEALLSVNDTVRDLVKTLQDEHELSRTVIFFTSDNGFMLREHDLTDKNKAYEESVHVPLVVRGPGFRGGSQSDATVSLADVTATIRRLAGVSDPHGADGVALQDVRAAPATYARRPVEIEGSTALYPQRAHLPTDSIGRFYTGAIWGPFTLVHYQTGDREFYDRSQDPWQMQNTYTPDPAPGSPQALLQQWYSHHVDCAGSACDDLIPAS